jgi:hypothetical protein
MIEDDHLGMWVGDLEESSKGLGLVFEAVISVEHAHNVRTFVHALINVADVACQEADVWIVLLRGLYGFCLDVDANHSPPPVLVEIVSRSASPAAGVQDDAMRIFLNARHCKFYRFFLAGVGVVSFSHEREDSLSKIGVH